MMTDGEWMEVAREFAEQGQIWRDEDFRLATKALARAMAMVAEETRGKPSCVDCNLAGITNCSHFDNCAGRWTCEYRTDAEIIARLRARLKSEKGTG